MTAFHPITPFKAVELVEAAGVPCGRRIIADFAAAGLVKSYALSIETVQVDGRSSCIRGCAVSPDLWQRIVRENVIDDVWTGGTVRLLADDLIGGRPEVRITGIGFSEKHLHRLVEHQHGPIPKAVPPSNVKPAPNEVADEVPAPPAARKRTQPDASAIPPGALVVTVDQAQKALGLGRTKINELMNEGRLVRKNIGRAVRIEVESIRALLGYRC